MKWQLLGKCLQKVIYDWILGCPRFFYNYKNLDDLKNNMTDFN